MIKIAVIGLGQIGNYLYNELKIKKKDIELKTGKKNKSEIIINKDTIKDPKEFFQLVDKFRSPHLWKRCNNNWYLRHTANKDGTDD